MGKRGKSVLRVPTELFANRLILNLEDQYLLSKCFCVSKYLPDPGQGLVFCLRKKQEGGGTLANTFLTNCQRGTGILDPFLL